MSGKRKYVWHEGRFVDVTNWVAPPRKTPYIIRDVMDGLVHPATGETYDSKARFREVTRAHGMVEVGNEPIKPNMRNATVDNPTERKKDIAQAIQMLEQGYTPPPVESVTEWGGETRMIGAHE